MALTGFPASSMFMERIIVLRTFLNFQRYLSNRFDSLLPEKYVVDGNSDYPRSMVRNYLKSNQNIFDIGGGKNPVLSMEEKLALNARVVGVDIDADELDRAPPLIYDETICADLRKLDVQNYADLIICRTLLEHVEDVPRAFKVMADVLSEGGELVIFVPNRNAAFARLNRLLPEGAKRWLLKTFDPGSEVDQGFRAFYDQCTPKDFKRLAEENSLIIVQEKYYYSSAYFKVFFPVHFVWRLWILLYSSVAGENAAETFAMAFRKDSFCKKSVQQVESEAALIEKRDNRKAVPGASGSRATTSNGRSRRREDVSNY